VGDTGSPTLWYTKDNMRITPHGVGSIVHIVKRGARGMEIVRDNHDRERFLDTLFFLNDTYKNDHWIREVAGLPRFARPDHWPKCEPLVDILGWTLLKNHIHMLVRVRKDRENGISEFARRIFRSMTAHFNEKYDERGSIFQGPYKSITVDSDKYLRYVIPYIMVKNTFEMYPGGLKSAIDNFDRAWDWATQYPYTSLGSYVGNTVSPILKTHNIIHEMFPTKESLKTASRDMFEAYRERHDDLLKMQLEI